MTETSTNRIERSGRKWSGEELRQACDESNKWWQSAEGRACRAAQGALKQHKAVFHKSLLAARARQLKN